MTREDDEALPEEVDVLTSTGSVREMILGSWRLSLIVVTPSLAFKYANTQGKRLLEQGSVLRLEAGRLRCADPARTELLAEKVRDTASKRGLYPDGLLGWSLQSQADRQQNWMIRLTALSSPKRTAPLVELRIAASEADAVPPVRLVAHTLGLTQTQARVAVEMVRGLAVGAIAEQLGIKPDTVKDHVKAIYQRLHIDGSRSQGVDAKALLVRKVMALAY